MNLDNNSRLRHPLSLQSRTLETKDLIMTTDPQNENETPLESTLDELDRLEARWSKLDRVTSSYVLIVLLPLILLVILPLFLVQVLFRLVSRGSEVILWKIGRLGTSLTDVMDGLGDFLIRWTPIIKGLHSEMETLDVERMETSHQAHILELRTTAKNIEEKSKAGGEGEGER